MFDGKTFDRKLDLSRLKSQLEMVKAILSTGEWVTLKMLEELTGGSQTALSARLRDLRKEKFRDGNYRIESKRIKSGLWHYRMVKESAVQSEMFS